ncbi:MAG: hypothetical protein CMP48_11185 [Rickettsiales bacterium]|nr:hypothetical protein [Rickettsiales bacterium]
MKHFNNTLHKNLFYNLIFFDFILLSSSSKKISNFFLEKIIFSKKKYLLHLLLYDLLKSFKQFIRLYLYIKKALTFKSLSFFMYIWSTNYQNIKLLKLLFKHYKIKIPLKIKNFFPVRINQSNHKNILTLDKKLNFNDCQNLFNKNFFLIQEINSYDSFLNFGTYKIYNDLTDFKKLIFIGLILIKIFKK